MKSGALLSGALALGVSGNVAAQETGNQTGEGNETGTGTGGDPAGGQASMFTDAFRPGSVFQVVSPGIEPPTDVNEQLQNQDVWVIEYFNTNEEVFLFLQPDAQIEQGERYVLLEGFTPAANGQNGNALVEVEYRPLDQDDFVFELEEGEDFEIVEDGGGEAAVRPQNFNEGALFRITSGPQDWVPEDVEDSGLFTDYNTHHAQFLGANDRFLIFAQEEAEVEQGALYVMWDEFELLQPDGNLVAADFDRVDEESLDIDDEFL